MARGSSWVMRRRDGAARASCGADAANQVAGASLHSSSCNDDVSPLCQLSGTRFSRSKDRDLRACGSATPPPRCEAGVRGQRQGTMDNSSPRWRVHVVQSDVLQPSMTCLNAALHVHTHGD